jgi:hypothetical protein
MLMPSAAWVVRLLREAQSDAFSVAFFEALMLLADPLRVGDTMMMKSERKSSIGVQRVSDRQFTSIKFTHASQRHS